MPIQYIRTSNGVEHKIKWACAGCINGHRSKGCDHFSQWMIQVGLPGRPKAKCPHVEPPCTCKTKERYLMVSIGTNADGECICQPYKAGQPREESSFMVPPIDEEPRVHQNPQMGTKFGPRPYSGFPNNGGIGFSDSMAGNNYGGPLLGYQHDAHKAYAQAHHLHSPPQSSTSQATLPPAQSPQYVSWNYSQGYPSHGRPQGSAHPVHHSWSAPSGYHPSPPAPNHYGGPTTTTLGQGHAHQPLGVDPNLPLTPIMTPPRGSERVSSHSHLGPDQQVLHWDYPQYPHEASPQTSSDQPFQNAILSTNHMPVQENDFIANSHSQQQAFSSLDLDAPIDDGLDPHFTHNKQQEQHVPASDFPDVDASGHSVASYDFLDFAETSLDPKLANVQCGQEQTGGYQATGRNHGKCQCGPGCNCLRCTTHPMNPATMEWVQNLYDTMDEDFNDESAPISRPQSSYGQPSAAPNLPGEDTESQAQDFDLELPQISPMDFDGYSILNFPINGCSNNAECRCGDNCRCEGCLTHSGHVKL